MPADRGTPSRPCSPLEIPPRACRSLQPPPCTLKTRAARRNWIRVPVLIYGSFVVATMVPILAELATHSGEGRGQARDGRAAGYGGQRGSFALFSAGHQVQQGVECLSFSLLFMMFPGRPAPTRLLAALFACPVCHPSTLRCPAARSGAAPGYNAAVVTGFYVPYLLLPLLMVVRMALNSEPFGSQPAAKHKQR